MALPLTQGAAFVLQTGTEANEAATMLARMLRKRRTRTTDKQPLVPQLV